MVLSSLPLTSICPSGLIPTLRTEPEWPVMVCNNAPLWRFHALIVLSAAPLASVCPSGLMATLRTELERPSMATLLTVFFKWPVRVLTKINSIFLVVDTVGAVNGSSSEELGWGSEREICSILSACSNLCPHFGQNTFPGRSLAPQAWHCSITGGGSSLAGVVELDVAS